MSLLALVLAPFVLLALPVPAGRYVLDDAAGARAAVDAAVAAAAAGVVFFLRPFAAGTLRDANPVRDAVDVSVEVGSDGRDRIRVTFAGAPVVDTVAGVDEDIVIDEHGTARVRQWREGSAIVQSATRSEGRRTVRITPVDDATGEAVVVDVRFESPQLTAPLVYRLRYRRS